MVVVAVAAILAAAGVFSFTRPVVKWSRVAEAIGRQDTLRGTARAYLPDGSEWECAVWAKIQGPGRTIRNAMVRPVKLPLSGPQGGGSGSTGPPRPSPTLLLLGEAMDVCGKDGIVTKLVASGRGRARGTRTEWGGKTAVMVEANTPRSLHLSDDYPDFWRFFIDPDSELVLAVSMFANRGGQRVLRARCEYEYNAPLPKGFREQ